MDTYKYRVNVGTGEAQGTVFVDKGAKEEEILSAIMYDLYDFSYELVSDNDNENEGEEEMRKIDGFENVKATDGEFVKPPAGGYCIEILDVEDVPMNPSTGKGDYLKIYYDICHGEFAGFYQKQHERFGGDYFTSFIRSYKEKALGMFKHFTNCVEESNVGYKWNWDEKTLVGKYVGVVLQEEEYQKQDGSVGTRMIVKDIKTIDQIGSGDFKIYETKKLDKTISWPAQPDPLLSTPFSEEELPFA